jgi:mono/diheme cytochrome c family protein
MVVAMLRIKACFIVIFIALAAAACFNSGAAEPYSIVKSKEPDASLFRQNCAICHSLEGTGKTLQDGTVVPSLREGEFKFKTEMEIYNQIANGGNGMNPFRGQLSDREIRMLANLVHNKLRNQK